MTQVSIELIRFRSELSSITKPLSAAVSDLVSVVLAHLSDLYASVPPFCRPEGLSGRLVGLLFQPRRVCLILGCQAGWLLAPVVSFRNSRTACFVLRNSSAVDLASCSLLLSVIAWFVFGMVEFYMTCVGLSIYPFDLFCFSLSPCMTCIV